MISEFVSLMKGDVDYFSFVIHICALLMVIFLVLPFHEWAHAWVASLLGDTNIKYRGRLSLNPMSHIDYIGALCLLLFGFGWAKPVPIDPSRYKNPKLGMAIVSAAGPLANVVAGLAGGFIYCGLYYLAPQFALANTIGRYIVLFLSYYIAINCSLAVFNLLPIPPLDGSKILFAFLPDKWVYKFYEKQQIISIVLMVLLFMGVLTVPLNILDSLLSNFILFICELPFKLIVG